MVNNNKYKENVELKKETMSIKEKKETEEEGCGRGCNF